MKFGVHGKIVIYEVIYQTQASGACHFRVACVKCSVLNAFLSLLVDANQDMSNLGRTLCI